jgi:hypothetical protein
MRFKIMIIAVIMFMAGTVNAAYDEHICTILKVGPVYDTTTQETVIELRLYTASEQLKTRVLVSDIENTGLAVALTAYALGTQVILRMDMNENDDPITSIRLYTPNP